MKNDDYIELIDEIFSGYSRFDFEGQTVFLRHFTFKDQKFLQNRYDKHHSKASSKGIRDEKELLADLIKDNTWTNEEENQVLELESYISNLEKSLTKIVLPSQQEVHKKLIIEEKAKLYVAKGKRKELIGKTASEYASNRSNEDFLSNLLYRDEELKTLFFSEEEFGELDERQLGFLMEKYYSFMNKFSDLNIQKASLEDCFSLFMPHCEKPYDLFGKPMYLFTLYQLKLLAYGRMFLHIFQNVDKIPDYIRKDPEALINFSESSRNKETLTKKMKDNSATAVFGATKQDLDYIDPSAKQVSLSELLAKNNGQLNMEQMMEVMGQ